MKTINKNKSSFPKPFRFAIYLIVVSIVGLMNWAVTYANDSSIEAKPNIEIRLAEALVPLPDPEPELEDWLLALSVTIISDSQEENTSLESRLDEALDPVDDLEPELEDWLLNFSDDILSGACE
jgi:hypothetical protein